MSDIQLYSFAFFWFGVILTKIIFSFEYKWREKETFSNLSVSIMRALWVINLSRISALVSSADKQKKSKEWEQGEYEEYLVKEYKVADKHMDSLTKILLSSFAGPIRDKIAFKNWNEVKKLAILMKNLKDQKDLEDD